MFFPAFASDGWYNFFCDRDWQEIPNSGFCGCRSTIFALIGFF